MLSKESTDLLKRKYHEKVNFVLSLNDADTERVEIVVKENGKERREAISLNAAKIALFYDIGIMRDIILHNGNASEK